MSKNIERFYNIFSFFYPLVDVFLKPQKRHLTNMLNEYPKGQLLEIGVGTGSHLHDYKNHEIIGIDISDRMLLKAKKRASQNISLFNMDGEALRFKNESFDYIVLSHIISVTTNPDKMLSEAKRVLKPNGKLFLLNHFTPNNWLKFIDKIFHPFSSLVHIKSLFYLNKLKIPANFKIDEILPLGRCAYYQLIVLKNEKTT